ADVELQPQLVPDRGDVGVGAVEQQVGVDVGQVTDEDGDALTEAPGLAPPGARPVALAELDVGGDLAPAGGGPVHDVGGGEGEGVEQLERGPGVDHPGIVTVTPGPDEAPVAKGRAQALASGVDQPLQGAQGLDQVGVERTPAGQLGVEEPFDA